MVRSAPGRKARAAVRASCLPFRGAGQQDVASLQRAGGQLQQQSARADLDVVGVRADRPAGTAAARRAAPGSMAAALDGPASTGPLAAPERSGSQIIQGQCPRWYISSSWARSFTVSAGDQ